MLNNVILVGRLTEDPDPTSNIITLAVNRSYKNEQGIYETDFIPVHLWSNNNTNACKDYTKKGDMIGIKGHIQTDTLQNIIIIADRITFLSQYKETEEVK